MDRGWSGVPQIGVYVVLIACVLIAVMSGKYLFPSTQIIEAQDTPVSVQTIPIAVSITRFNIHDFPATHYADEANLYYDSGDYERVIQNLNYALTINPNEPMFYLNRAQTYIKLGLLPLAANDYEEIIELSPDIASFSPYFYDLGNAAYELQLFDQAVAYFSRAITLGVNDALYYYSLARSYEALGDAQSALENYERVIALNPGLGYDIVLDWGIRAQNSADYEQSLIYFNQAIGILPQENGAYRYRAMSYYLLGYKEQSFADLLQALQISPNQPIVYEAIGWYYEQEGDPYMAAIYNQRAKELEIAP